MLSNEQEQYSLYFVPIFLGNGCAKGNAAAGWGVTNTGGVSKKTIGIVLNSKLFKNPRQEWIGLADRQHI